jgi:endo-1,3(4)-beta-glucanase
MAIPEHLKQFQVRITESTKAGSREDAKKRGKRADQPSAQNPLVPWEAVDVGRVLKIKGQVTTFRGMKQIDVIKIEVLGGTEGEVRCWDEMVAFRRDVLSVPWVVSPEEEEGCRRERERSLRRERKKAKGGSSKREVEEEGHGEGSGSRAKGKEVENEDRRRRHEAKKRKKEREEGLDPRDNVNYPSMAVRRRVAGKYDALGI